MYKQKSDRRQQVIVEGNLLLNLVKIGKKKIFPNWEWKRYPVGSKAHTLPLSHSQPVGPQRNRIIFIRNISWAHKNS